MKHRKSILAILLTAVFCVSNFPAFAADTASGGFSDAFDEKENFEGWQKNKSECDTFMEITEDGYLHYTCENSGGNNTTVGGVIRSVNNGKGLTFAENAEAVLKFRVKKEAGAVVWVNTDVPLDGGKTMTIPNWYAGDDDWRSSLNAIKIYDDKIEVKKWNNSFPYTEYDRFNVQTADKWIDFTVYYDVSAKKADWTAEIDGEVFSGKGKDWSYFGNVRAVTDAKWGTIAFLSYGYNGTSTSGNVYIDNVSLAAIKNADMFLEGAEEVDGAAHFYLNTDVRLDSVDSIVLKDSEDNEVPTDISYLNDNTNILDIEAKEALHEGEYKISGLKGLNADGVILSDIEDITVYSPEKFPIEEDFADDCGKWKEEENGYEPQSVKTENGALTFVSAAGGQNENQASVLTRVINNKMGLLYKEDQNILIKTRIKKDSDESELSLQLNRIDTNVPNDKNAFSLLKICDDKILYRNGSVVNENNMQTLYEGECNKKWMDITIYLDGYNKKALYFVTVEGTPFLCSVEGALDSPFDTEKAINSLSIKASGKETKAYMDYFEVYKNEEPLHEDAVVSGYAEKGSELILSCANRKDMGDVSKYSIKWLIADNADGEFTEIEGAFGTSHIVTDEEDAKVIKAEITEINPDGSAGEVFYSNNVMKRMAPEAMNVDFEGEMSTGETLVGKYDYFDINGDEEDRENTKYAWYRGSSSNGSFEKISGADKITYTLTDEDIGKYIKFSVLPAAKEEPQVSQKEYLSGAKLGPVKPVLKNVKLKHQGAIYYVAEYEYIHEHNYEQGEFKYTWYADGREISNTNSCTVTGKCNKLELVVVPVSKKAPYEGDPVTVTVGVSSSDSKGSTGVSSGGGSGGGSSIGKTAESVIKDAEKENEQNTKLQVTALDIDNHWGKENILFVLNNGIMTCDENNYFNPEKPAKRSEVIAAAARSFGVTEVEYREEFSDVKKEDSYSGYLQALVDMGVISHDTAFRPDDRITREEMSKVLVILLGYSADADSIDEIAHFSDNEDMGDWAKKYIAAASLNKLMLGVSNTEFRPKGNITNAQLATLCKRIADFKGGQKSE